LSPEGLISLGFSPEMVVIIISALPVAELRVALPVAINLFHLPWYYALLLAVAGSLLPVPLLLLFFDSLSRLLGRVRVMERGLNWLFERIRKRGTIIERYERIGLVLFVAIPLPVTGVWTGSIAAVLLGLRFRYAFIAISIGAFIAGAIVTALCLLGWVGAVIAGVGLGGLAVASLWRFQLVEIGGSHGEETLSK